MEECIFTEEMDGVNNCIEQGKTNYILLVTKSADKPFCMFYITDGFQDFWLARFDSCYFKDTVQNMNIETDFRSAIRSIAEALKKNVEFKITEDNVGILEIRIQLEGSVTLKHTFRLSVNINSMVSQKEFRTCNKSFVKFLFDAKNKEIAKVRNELGESQKPKIQKEEKQSHEKYMSKILRMDEKEKDKRKPVKRGDLINPYRSRPRPHQISYMVDSEEGTTIKKQRKDEE